MSTRRTVWQARLWRATVVSGLLTLALCALGLMAATFVGLEVNETCRLEEGQDFDLEYWAAHQQGSPLPPYSAPCNAEYDMVPPWVNPAIAVSTALCAMSLAGLAVGRGARWTRTRGRVPADRR